jgi:tetratricopeptide (TPR) repeat protein
MVAASLSSLGEVHRQRGDLGSAIHHHRRALAIAEAALGGEHPDVGRILDNLVVATTAAGRYQEATALNRRVLAIKEKALGPDHPAVASAVMNDVVVALARRRHRDARAHAERALGILERSVGPDHPDVADPLLAIGDSHVGQGRAAAAIPFYERAVRLRETDQAGGHLLPEAQLALAGAVWDAGLDRPRAIELARAARRGAVAADRPTESVDAWLAAHAPR